jgi:predicted DsbA family dithiol-disulfide isomerase
MKSGLVRDTGTVQVTHYSDVLCVWAYVSQIRCDELLAQHPEQVEIDCRFFHVFGDIRTKIEKGWAKRGGLAAYSEHVQSVVKAFPHVEVHPETWLRNPPASSMPAHLVLCAVRQLVDSGDANRGAVMSVAWRIREAFFRDAMPIDSPEALLRLAALGGVDAEEVAALIANGRAHAALAADLELARSQNVQSSPTLIFNEGRQRLTGNVGYRIIEANVRELLERPDGQSSWC